MIAACAVVAPVPPFAIAIVVAFHVPVPIVPTDVRLLVVTFDPNAVELKTSTPFILYVFPETILIFSLEVNAALVLSY